jgi:hypothetical protein
LNDHIHLKGAVTDTGAGLSCVALQYRIDGANGARGSAQPLPGCTADGTKSITFDISALSLIDAKNGRLGAGTGNLQLVIVAGDAIVGTPNMLPEAPQAIAVTRLWWSRQFTPDAVTGIAVHPDGDVIVTSNASVNDSVVVLFRDGPFHSDAGGVNWSFRAGTIPGGPAIGTDAAGQPIYVGGVVSATIRNILSLKSDAPPTVIWSAPVNAAPTDAPAVAPGAIQVGGVANCEAVVAGGGSLILAACQVPGSQGGSNAAVRIGSASPGAIETVGNAPITIAGGAIYASTDKSIARTVLLSDGTLDIPVRFANSSGGNYTGVLPVGDGRLVSGSGRDNSIYGVAFNGTGFDPGFTANVNAIIQGMPIFNSASAISFVTGDNKLHSMTTGGADSVIAPVTAPGGTPLLGHDGISYVGRNGAITAILPSGNVGWEVALPAKATVAPTMDCAGALYVAASDSVYAVITDMMSDPNNAGLADTPWPKFQRDSRNTGNADIPIRYGVRTSPGPGGCIQ